MESWYIHTRIYKSSNVFSIPRETNNLYPITVFVKYALPSAFRSYSNFFNNLRNSSFSLSFVNSCENDLFDYWPLNNVEIIKVKIFLHARFMFNSVMLKFNFSTLVLSQLKYPIPNYSYNISGLGCLQRI